MLCTGNSLQTAGNACLSSYVVCLSSYIICTKLHFWSSVSLSVLPHLVSHCYCKDCSLVVFSPLPINTHSNLYYGYCYSDSITCRGFCYYVTTQVNAWLALYMSWKGKNSCIYVGSSTSVMHNCKCPWKTGISCMLKLNTACKYSFKSVLWLLLF